MCLQMRFVLFRKSFNSHIYETHSSATITYVRQFDLGFLEFFLLLPDHLLEVVQLSRLRVPLLQRLSQVTVLLANHSAKVQSRDIIFLKINVCNDHIFLHNYLVVITFKHTVKIAIFGNF
jgi:hypothetical protein